MNANTTKAYQQQAGVYSGNRITVKLNLGSSEIAEPVRPKFCTQCGFQFQELSDRFCGECGGKRY